MLIKNDMREGQAGMMLLEGLIAILIFSLGIIALVGMQAAATKQVSDAKYRSDAGLLASQLLGMMWASDRTPAALKAKFDTSAGSQSSSEAASDAENMSDELNSWKNSVETTLPGITATQNQPVVDVTSIGSVNDGTVTITIRWMAPGDADFHKYVTVAQVK